MSLAPARYTRVAVGLHWAIAAFILAGLLLGTFMEGIGDRELRSTAVRLHVSFGASVFALAILRVVWRLGHPAPAFPANYRPWERVAAHAAHLSLYVAMFVMPILGWLIISANYLRPMMIYGLWTLPPFPYFMRIPAGPDKKALHDLMVELHSIGGWIVLALLLVHVAGALKHQFIDGHAELQRMWFRRRPGESQR